MANKPSNAAMKRALQAAEQRYNSAAFLAASDAADLYLAVEMLKEHIASKSKARPAKKSTKAKK